MYATVRRYQGTGGRSEEVASAVRKVASSLGNVDGFVSCLVLEVEPGVLAVVGVFEDKRGLAAAHGLLEAFLGEQRGHLLSQDPQTTSGEIVFQRGL